MSRNPAIRGVIDMTTKLTPKRDHPPLPSGKGAGWVNHASSRADRLKDSPFHETPSREEIFRAAFTQNFRFSCLLTPTGEVAETNEAARTLLGWKHQEARGIPLWEAPCFRYSEETVSRIRRGIHEADAGFLGSFESAVAREDGPYKTYDFCIKGIRDAAGVITHLLVEGNDVTERKMAEQSFLQGKLLAESANRMKSEFIAMMGHEIRTPLNGMLGFSRLLESTNVTLEQREFIRSMTESGMQLLHLLNDILDISKMEAGMLALHEAPFILNEIVAETCHLFREEAEAKGLTLSHGLSPEIPSLLSGDETRLRQIFFHLIQNAVKFTPRGRVDVHVTLEKQPERGMCELLFSVMDTGIGIAQPQHATIFQPFVQVDSSSRRRYQGAGLGLAICSRLVHLMRGRVWVESAPEQGSTFYVRLPLKVTGAGMLQSE